MPSLKSHKRISATVTLLSVFSLGSFAQLPSQNYVLTRTFLNASGSRYIEETQIYDGLGRPSATSILGAGEYGKIDNLNIKLNGNQLLSVTDDALPANKYSSMNFVDGADEDTEYEYNGVGALTKDLNRGLTIEYDNMNNPRFMRFDDGNTILYDYSSDGTLLSKTYGAQKAEPLTSKSMFNGENENNSTTGSTLTPTILYSGTTEYSGDFIYKNGKPSKVLFPGGYCTFDHETNEPQFHYFTQDHLGNNRAVVSESGEAKQITHYYPFGGTFGDAGLNPALQQYKYNCKELDRVAGLNTYDYGARQYYPLVPWWDRMDKMCEKHYELSPYLICGNNPVNRIEKDGKDWYYSKSGQYLGRDNKPSDNIIIRERNIRTLGNPSWQQAQSKYVDVNISNVELSVDAYSNIFTDILVRNGFNMMKTGSGKVEVAKTDGLNSFDQTSRASTSYESIAVTTHGRDVFNITALINTGYGGTQSLFSTVSNVVSILGVHEYKVHGLYKYNNKASGHIKIRKLLQKDPTYKKITNELKNHIDKLEFLY